MFIQDGILKNSEAISIQLRELYLKYGYAPYRMSKFEEYDFYAHHKDFLISDNVITFTDTNGKLMALKPDVTLSIIKNSKDDAESTQRFFYNESVYRVSKGTNSFTEIMQTGLECIGNVNEKEIYEVLFLAGKSLQMISEKCVLSVSDLGLIESILDELQLQNGSKKQFFKALGEKNTHEMDEIFKDACVPAEKMEALKRIVLLHGQVKEIKEELTKILSVFSNTEKFFENLKVFEQLSESEIGNILSLDFSVVDDINYYNGIVFKGFVSGIASSVLSGGSYDRLMKRMKKSSKAIGFAVYPGSLERLEESTGNEDEYLNVALPKGRLGDKVYAMFAAAGFECPSILEPNRKLIFENPEKKVRYFWVKPSDVAIYVERGAADIGVAGKDILLEYGPDIYELLDLDMGKCRMAVAGKKGYKDSMQSTLRVATKFSEIARQYYQLKGRDIDIIHLNGSIEIAPILGLSDVIVDIVETGTTLKENDLEVLETIVPISARLISNKSAFKFKSSQIESVRNGLMKVMEEKQ